MVKVDFDLTLSLAAHNIYRVIALMLEGHESETSKSLYTKFFSNSGGIEIMNDRIRVLLKKKRHLPILIEALDEIGPIHIPWLENRFLEFQPWTVT